MHFVSHHVFVIEVPRRARESIIYLKRGANEVWIPLRCPRAALSFHHGYIPWKSLPFKSPHCAENDSH
jgi:hypothetical protein